jgi:predicted amidohydrolase YtcJ
MTRINAASFHAVLLVFTSAIWLMFALVFAPSSVIANSTSDLRSADTVLLDGKIITVDQNNSIAQAVAIKNGRIQAVGDSATIKQLIGPDTHIVQLHGKAVPPGFIDAHTHIEGIAHYHRMLDLHIPPLRDVQEMLQKIRERAALTPKGQWIVGAGGWGQPMPTRQQLDSVASDHPVLVREGAHEIIANSKALELAGINKGTPNRQGAKFWKDPNTGQPTGRLSEMFGRMLTLIPKLSYDVREQSIKEVLQTFVRYGVTTIYDFPSPDGLRMYQSLRRGGFCGST